MYLHDAILISNDVVTVFLKNDMTRNTRFIDILGELLKYLDVLIDRSGKTIHLEQGM